MSFYTLTTGCTTYDTGRGGTVTEFHRMHGRLVGAFVKEWDGGMFYVTLSVSDDGGYEVAGTRQISRDEFDGLTDVALLRHTLGWRA